MHKSHTGANLAQAIYLMLVQYKIENRLLTVVADNVTNNDTLGTELAMSIGGDGLFRGTEHHLRCFAHVLNLIMQASRYHFWRLPL
ncbi:MAG: hypothetical protein ACREHG_06965 [Candidatus Saccharimonadales bacterium]